MLSKVNLQDAFSSIDAEWSPRIGATIAGVAVKLTRVSGDFIWHHHDVEDELFLVVKGELTMRLRDGDVVVTPGEWIVVPHGVEHQPSASADTWVLLIEPTETLNTGNVVSERTVQPTVLQGSS
jgi:mannose-6-phosphate isomerase-like protein (cupin superfamily)